MPPKPCPSANDDLCVNMLAAIEAMNPGSKPTLPHPPHIHKGINYNRWVSHVKFYLHIAELLSSLREQLTQSIKIACHFPSYTLKFLTTVAQVLFPDTITSLCAVIFKKR